MFFGLWFGLLAAAGVSSQPNMVYIGYNHLLTIDGTADVYDYHRNLKSDSTCNVFLLPPILDNVTVADMVINSHPTHVELEYMGYESFISQNKVTGQYVIRRCHDVKVGLPGLPCDPFASGVAERIRYPWRTLFIEHNRAVLYNEVTAQFGVYAFDADVHNGADPFHFTLPPVHSGYINAIEDLPRTNLAHVALPNQGGEIIVTHNAGHVQAYFFDGSLGNRFTTFVGPKVYEGRIQTGFTMKKFGENQVLFYSPDYDFEIWSFVRQAYRHRNQTFAVRAIHNYQGNLVKEHSCMKHDQQSCLESIGCAWCPSENSCYNYDFKYNILCETQFCKNDTPIPGISPLNPYVPKSPSPSPSPGILTFSPNTPTENSPPTKTIDDSIDTDVDAGTGSTGTPDTTSIATPPTQTSGNPRPILPPDLRVTTGPPTAVVVVIEADPKNFVYPIEEDNVEDVLMEKKRIGAGAVFVPQAPSDCMDGGYDPNQAVFIPDVAKATAQMNAAEFPFETLTTSPDGDDQHPGKPNPDCANSTAQVIVARIRRAAKYETGPNYASRRVGYPPGPKMLPGPVLRPSPKLRGGDWMNKGEGCDSYSCDCAENEDEAENPANEDFEDVMNNNDLRQDYLPRSEAEHEKMFGNDRYVQDFIPLPAYTPPAPEIPTPEVVIYEATPIPTPVPVEGLEYEPIPETPTPTPTPVPTPTPYEPIQETHHTPGNGPASNTGAYVIPIERDAHGYE